MKPLTTRINDGVRAYFRRQYPFLSEPRMLIALIIVVVATGDMLLLVAITDDVTAILATVVWSWIAIIIFGLLMIKGIIPGKELSKDIQSRSATKNERPAKAVKRTQSPLGFVRDGRQYLGYEDDPKLPESDRRKIALWARSLGEPSSEQLALIERTNPVVSTPGQAEALEVLSPSASPAWPLLSDEQQALVINPSLIPGVHWYPLTVDQVSEATGATRDQLRHWADTGLIRPVRSDDGHRRFYPEAFMAAFVYASRLKKNEGKKP